MEAEACSAAEGARAWALYVFFYWLRFASILHRSPDWDACSSSSRGARVRDGAANAEQACAAYARVRAWV